MAKNKTLTFGDDGPTIDLGKAVGDVVAQVEATGDPEIAAAVAEVEGNAKRPRKTLLAALAKLADEPAGPDEAPAVAAADGDDEEPRPKPGTPTEPDRGGLNPTERAAFAPPGPAPKPTKTQAGGPSITGSDTKAGIGVPTEPDRGGLSPLERRLQGAR